MIHHEEHGEHEEISFRRNLFSDFVPFVPFVVSGFSYSVRNVTSLLSTFSADSRSLVE